MSLNTVYASILTVAVADVISVLTTFAADPLFAEKFTLAFGKPISAEQFLQGVAVLPEIEVVTDSELQGALGAFSVQTQKIYLSQGLVAGDSARLRSVLIEEIGHYLDAQVNSVDSPGDEGAIFAAVVLGQDLSASQLAQLKAEDDHGVINLNGNVIEVEQATGANLVVTDFTAPATALSGQTISLSWTVQNQGQDSTTSSYWYDYVYYSTDDVFGNSDDVYLNSSYPSSLPLDSNETYTLTANVTLSQNLIENGYLLFKTDSYNYQTESDETDNVKSVAISVAAPQDNLVVTDFTAPATALSGQTISLSWTVQNQGQDSTTSSYGWYDNFVYSTDDVFGNSDDVNITYVQAYSANVNLPLDPDETYTLTANIALPPDLIGNGYLLVKTDGYEQQTETDETDNVKAVVISVTAPEANLVVTDFTAPATALSGQTISLSWTVQNQGQDPATFTSNYGYYYYYYYYWNDSIVYSTDDVFGNSDDVYLTGIQADSYNANLPLDPNETYTLTANVTLPQDLIGNGYLLVKSDGYNERTETDETDNVKAVAISVAAPEVNLVVTDFTAPTTASLGQTISLSWTVQNQGQDPTTASYWYDYVYYSTDDVFGNSDDVYLTYRYADSTNLPLDPDETYTLTANITLSNNLSGSGYLFVKTDGNNYQSETDETDNTYSVPIAISKPNLVVTDFTAPTSANIGEAISVSWTVKNQGTLATTSSYWYDYVYYSTDDVFGNSDDVYLTYGYAYSANANLPLAPNESYTLTANVTLPSNLAGSGYLFVKTDGNNYQTETDETDNTHSIPITVSGANLVITSATAPTTANSGSTVDLSWTVENKGDGATTASNWYDQVVFSKDTTFGNSDDISVASYISISSYANLPLDPDETYTINQSIALPNGIGGSGYLLFKTDHYSYQSETNEQDNVYSLAIDVTAPNLVISNPTAPPTSAILGETIAVSWQVTNTGTVAANGDWYDSVYLSNDDKFDSSDTSVGGVWTSEKTPLAAGTSYTISQNLTLPSSAGVGSRYLLFVADAGKYQGETSETDNVVATPISLSAPDLIVSAATAPETGVARGTVNVSWTVKNQGTVSAPTNWYDSVYLSTDNIFSTYDTLVANQYISEQTPLAADGSYTIDRSINLPNVAPGNYYLLFKADGYYSNYQGETDETNNVRAVAITVTAPDLVVSAATVPTNGIANGAIAVSYTVTNQGNVASSTNWYDYIYLSTDATYDYGDTYVSGQYISSPTSLGAGESYTKDFNLTLPNLPAGDYYLLFLADLGNYQYETDETNNNRAVPITIGVPDLSISEATAPTSGGLGESVTLSWKVTNSSTVTAPADWTDRVYFSLDDIWDSSDTIVASQSITTQTPLIAGNNYSISKSFTLPNKTNAIGSGYLLFVTDADTTQAETSETNNVQAVAFTLNAPNLAVTSATASSSVAVGETINVTWDVTNQGTVAANGDWYDSVYISDDATFDSSDQWLSYRWSSSNTPLGAGASYTGSLAVTLPTTATGDRYLLFVADNYNYNYYYYNNNQGETNETDNFYAIPINISAADLTIDSATAPSTAIAGETVELSWTVKNQGTGQAARDWYDYVYLSTNNTLDGSDTLLSSELIAAQTPLTAGSSYSITKNVALSTNIIGQRYLIFTADGSGHQGETNENNNTKVIAINFVAPDLVVSDATAPTSGNLGSSVAVSWTVTNQSSTDAPADWSDYVYLSNDSVLDGSDTLVASESISSQTPLVAGNSYTINRNINLTGNTAIGSRYLLFVADGSQNQGETDNNNNVRAVSITLNAADLVVSNVTAPVEIISGQSLEIAWTDKNQGTGAATGTWYDYVYLENQDGGQNYYLGNFEFTGTLAPGASIDRSQSINLPIQLQGNYRVVVTTDYHGQIPESLQNESNNTTVGNPLQVKLAPIPNLQVSSVTAPLTAFSSQSTAIQWTVKNVGNGATSSPYWSDFVYLSLDNIFDNTDIYLGQANNPSYLNAGDSYTNHLDVTLPRGISGNYYFLVKTDVYNYVFENDQENDNLTVGGPTSVSLSPPPDFQVTNVTTPSQAFSGQSLNLSWTVTNQGLGKNLETVWYDQVFMSTDEVLDAGDRNLGTFYQNGTLNSDGSYTSSQTVSLPIGISGDYYFFVQTDAGNQVYENVFDGNNTGHKTTPTRINLTPPPDLEIASLTAPTQATASRALNFSYQVTNFGSTATPNYYWADRFYLSLDNQLDLNTDLHIGDQYHYGSLAPDESYTNNFSYTLPNTLTGNYYLFGITDSNNEVFELNNENNTFLVATPIVITSQPADLIVVSASAPTTGEAGKALRVEWTVRNQGTGDTAVSGWTDRVVLSQDAQVGNSDDIVLGEFSRGEILAPNQSYTRSELVTLPFDASAGYQVFVVTDVGNSVYEATQENNNNSTGQPLTVTRDTADLQVTQVSSPSSGQSGQALTVDWTVKNLGSNRTNNNYWYDGVYLSTDNQISNDDIFLGYAYRSEALAASEQYSVSRSFNLPNNLQAGNYYTLVRADVYNYVYEGSLENNNDKATEGTTAGTNIGVTASPDLVMVSVDAPTTGIAGQNLTVNWTVSNAGTVETGDRSWYEAFYLSRDQVFDRNSDTYLGYRYYTGNLAAGATYSQTESFRLPQGISGPFYLFVQTDSGNWLYEGTAENNNVIYDPNSVEVSLAQPADLVVGTITIPANGVTGQNASITYTVTNEGSNAVVGNWSDSLYLSKDGQWDINDLFLGQVDNSEEVLSGDSYTNTLTASLPGVVPGDYQVIIRSDIRNQIPESNESNNLKATLDKVNVDVERLTLGTPSTGTLIQGQGVYYRFNATAGQTIRLRMDSQNNETVNSLFISRDKIPTRTKFEITDTTPFIADPTIVLPITEDGTYYVLAYDYDSADATPYSLIAEEIPFSILGLGVKKVGNTGEVTIEVDGALFANDTNFRLADSTGKTINAKRTFLENSTKAYVTFDLDGQTADIYDVQAVKADGKVVSLNDSLTVQDNFDAKLATEIYGPLEVRPQRDYTFNLSYGNTGGTDIISPLLLVESAANTPLGLSQRSMKGVTLQILSSNDNGPIDILRPGETESVAVYFKSSQVNDLGFRIRAIDADDTTEISVEDWSNIEKSVRPNGLTDSQWQSFWGGIQPRIGTTWGDYVQMLNRLSHEVSSVGEGERDVRDMFAELYGVDPNYHPASSMSGQLLDAKTGEVLAGVEVVAYRSVNGVYESGGNAVTDAEGLFTISYLQAGNYELALADKNFDMDRDGNEDFQSPSYTVSETSDLTGVTVYGHHPEPVAIHENNDSKPQLILDSAGKQHLFWIRNGEVWHSRFNDTSWVDAEAIPGILTDNFSVSVAANLIDGSNSGFVLTWQDGQQINGSNIYYTVARFNNSGGLDWAEPLQLTNDTVADSQPSVIIKDNGQPLIVYQKSDQSLQDDTDLYYNLLDIQSANLDFIQPFLLNDFLIVPEDVNQTKQSFSIGYRFEGTPKSKFFQKLASLKAEVKVEGTYDLSCTLTAQALGSLQLELSSSTYRSQKILGAGSYSGTWIANPKTCKYDFQKSTLSGNVASSIDFKLPLEDAAYIVLSEFPGVNIGAQLILAYLRQKKIFGGEAGLNVRGIIGGNVQWTQPEAPPFAFRLPDKGAFTADVQIGLYGKAFAGSNEVKVYGNVGAKSDVWPDPQLKSVFGQLGVDVKWGSRLFTYKYTPSLDIQSLSSLSTDDFSLLTDSQSLGNLTFEYHSDPSLILGTNNTYFDEQNSSIIADVSSDLYNDSPPVFAKGVNGQILMAWTHEVADANQDGSIVLVSSYKDTGWDVPIQLPKSLGYNNDVSLVFDSNGNPIAVWSMADSSNITSSMSAEEVLSAIFESDIVYSVFQNNVWSDPTTLYHLDGSDSTTSLAKTSDGQVILTWIHQNTNNSSLFTSFWNGTSWTLPQTITVGDIVGNASISTLNSKSAVLWTEDINPDPEITQTSLYYSIYDRGWSTPGLFTPELSVVQTELVNFQASQLADLTTKSGDLFTLGLPTPPEECCDCKDPKVRRRIESRTPCNGRSGSETTFDKETCIETTIVYIPETCPPKDPNDIIGPIGFGQENWIANTALPYTIRFENDPVFASAAAQEVTITQQLDADLDWRTFRLDDFGWGGLIFDLPGDTAFHSQRFDFTQEHGFFVDVSAGVDITSGIVTWHIITIDPTTGDKPLGVDQGFLPVNNDEGIGEGFVSYQVRTKRTIQTGTVIDAQARIIFDTEEPIDTPAIFNTIDLNAPISSVQSLPAVSDNQEFLVQWQGSDDSNGSAIADYTVYVSENGGTFTPWLVDTLLTEANYIGTPGNTYAFYTIAKDNAGNIQLSPNSAQATTTISGGTGSIGDFIWLDKNANGIQDIGETGLANVTVKLYDSTNNLIATATTDNAGNYSFSNLTTGDYALEVIAPNTYLFSPKNQGIDSQDSDVNSSSGKTDLFAINAGNNSAWDAGLYQLASISGQIWNDLNGNAINNSEPKLSGWTVYLDSNNNNQLDIGETSTQTDANGNYSFTNLRPGTYNVAQIVQTGWQQTYPILNVTTTASDIALSIPTLDFLTASEPTLINLNSANYLVQEDGTAVTEFWVTRTGNVSNAVNVTLSFLDGTAKGCGCAASSVNNDFNNVPFTLTFAENETNKLITVQNAILGNPNAIRIRNDSKAEGNETFTIKLTNPTGGAVIGEQGTATVTILDDESPTPVTPPLESPGTTLADAGDDQALSLISLDKLWQDSRFLDIKGKNYSTVIIDTGIDLNHFFFGPDANNDGIADKIIYQYDFADNDNNASDKNNHGSHVASIVSSVAPDANLIVLKVFKDGGSGSFADLEKALQWVNTNASTYNIASVNLSLGDSQNWVTQTSRYGIGDELASIANQNVIISAAAGNSFYQFNSTQGLAYPAIDPNVVAVGAVWSGNFGGSKSFNGGAIDYTTSADQIASFSQRDDLFSEVFAPGILITGANATGGTISMGGTSQAAPFLTGLATLAQEIAQDVLGRWLSVSEFRYLLDTTSNLILDGDNENDNVINTGLTFPRINALKLAEGILGFNGIISDSNTGNSGSNSGGNSSTSPNTVSLVHTVNLVAGQVATGIDFGNQILNQLPTITSGTTANFAENGTGIAYTVTATDPEGTTLTYGLLNSDADASLFNVNSTTGAITFKTAPDFETPLDNGADNTYNLTVTANDGSLTSSKAIVITVTDLNEIQGNPLINNGRNPIIGTAGPDYITGGAGAKTLTGGGGNDSFVFTDMRDVGQRIADFTVGEDKLVFTQLFSSLGYKGSNPIADGYIKFVQGTGANSAHTFLQIDRDGLIGSAIARNFLQVDNLTPTQLNNINNFQF